MSIYVDDEKIGGNIGVDSLNSQTGGVNLTSTDTSVTISASGGNVDLSVATGTTISWAKFSDTKTSGTAGGTFTSGSPQTHALTTEDYDPDGIASLSSNQVTIPSAGEYEVIAYAVGHVSDKHQISWVSQSGDSVSIFGTIGNCANIGVHSVSMLHDFFTLTQSTVFELEHECTLTRATDGYGEAGSMNEERYAEVIIKKIG